VRNVRNGVCGAVPVLSRDVSEPGNAPPTHVRKDAPVLERAGGVDVEARVAALVEARRAELEQLVRQAVDRELEALVAAELAHRNGNGAVAASSPSAELDVPRPLAPAPEELRLCRVCGEQPAQQHRTVCGRCRERERKQRRERVAGDSGEDPPRPEPRE
jgi:hypothetical protein